MILIADSGSSKTDWALLNGTEVQYLRTEGLNPRQKTRDEIVAVLQKEIPRSKADAIQKIYFYGAGCSGSSGKQVIADAICSVFPRAEIEISTDLHGAALGLFGRSNGIIAILGTGSNCGFWDGETIKVQPVSLGYLLGDEGSGFHIGKLIAEFYLKKNMPPALSLKLEERYALSSEDLITQLYQQKKPNVYLARLSHFASENRSDEFIKALLDESFGLFFRDYITKLPNAAERRIKITGSIASTFESEIKNTAWKFGCQVSSVTQSPINGLADYFTSI
jgi:glucosamine kinase